MTLPLMAKDHAQWGLLVVFVHHVALPLGALAEHNQRVIARICALLLDEHLDEFVEIDLVFGADTADRGDARVWSAVKSRPKTRKMPIPLVRADGGPLALDMRGAFFLSVRAYIYCCLLYTSPSPRDRTRSRMPSSA